MRNKQFRVHVGLRTIKTAAAAIVAMLIVDAYGASPSKLIFAMLGAMAAMQPTFKESVEACLTQIVGVLFGAVVGVLLLYIPFPNLAVAGIGMILVITLYNTLHIRFSPGLPCLIVVILCTTENIQPVSYALGRIWDSTIGLTVGLFINMLVFPYDNSRRICATVESLDRELILFLEDMFDGDDRMPDAEKMAAKVDEMNRQLKIFSNQKLLLRMNRQHRDLETFRACEGKARELVARMEVLCRMDEPGHLNEENRARLIDCGAHIRDERPFRPECERDIVVNYHITQILRLRQDLLNGLERRSK